MLALRALSEVSDTALRELYRPPRLPWWRLNVVQTLDGAATGPDGVSKSIHNDADDRVFTMLRERCDVIVVGAATVREEGYRPNAKPMIVLTRSGQMPLSLAAGDTSRVSLAGSLEQARALTEEHGFREVLCEGGPTVARQLLAAGMLDELCCTTVPRVTAGDGPRILVGDPIDVPLHLEGILEERGTLLQRWRVG